MLRRYRRALGLRQADFAKRVGVTQAAVSLLEAGRMPLSEALAQTIWNEFDRPGVRPRLGRFLEQQASEQRQSAPMASRSFTTLPVFTWTPRLDLEDDPGTMPTRGLVTVLLAPGSRALVLEMPEKTDAWVSGEILVFAVCGVEHCRADDLCLLRPARSRRRNATVVARVVRPRGKSMAARHFEPLLPKGPRVPARADAVKDVLRCVYRARYVDGQPPR